MDYSSFLPEDFICNESFQHFCSGTVQKDILFWEKWINDNPKKKDEVDEAMRMVNMLRAKQGNLAEQKHLLKDTFTRREQFRDKVFGSVPIRHISKNLNPIWKRQYIFPVVAACFALIIFGGGYLFLNHSGTTNFDKMEQNAPTYTSGLQLRNTILLSDGSLITLAKNSTIKLAEGFSANKREVTLSGEAYFDIKHDANSPFIVYTSRMELVVLGTVFNVKDFADSSSSEAFLISGRIRVSDKKDSKNSVVLNPNESVIISTKKGKGVLTSKPETPLVVSTIDSAINTKNLGWIHNRLSIDDEPLYEIAKRLQDWYGIQIIFADDSVKNYRYSGTFESETVLQALQALQLSYPFKFKTTPQQIIISK